MVALKSCKKCPKKIYHSGLCDDCFTKWNIQKAEQLIADQIKNVIPEKFLHIETDRDYKEYLGKNLFIFGAVGIGKSVLMSSIAKQLIRNGQSVRKWVSYPALSMRIKGSFKGDDSDVYTIVQSIASYEGWILIDDMRAETESGIIKEATYYIINEREVKNLPIIITSNVSLPNWEQRIASRISGMCEIIMLGGTEDRRLSK